MARALKDSPCLTGAAFAVALYALVAGAVLAADLWDPLADWGPSVITLASLALGLLVGRWRAAAFAAFLLPLALLGPRDHPLALFFLAVIGVPFEAAVVAAGVGLRKALDRRQAMAGKLLGATAMGAALALVGYGVYLDARVVDESPSAPLLLDEQTGAYRGLQTGASLDRLQSLFGPGTPGDPNRVPSPLEVGPTEVSGPPFLPADLTTLRYPDLAVLVQGGRVRGYVTTAEDAETRAGVGVGDSLSVAKQRYAGLACGVKDLGHDQPYPAYPQCFGRLPTGETLSFGGDPIDSLWVIADRTFSAEAPPLQIPEGSEDDRGAAPG